MIPTITPQQRESFAENGYAIFENVFTPDEMNELAAQIEAHQQRHEEALRARENSGSDISRAGEITFTDHLAERDALIRAFTQRPEFVALATEWLGPDVDLYWNQSVFKGPDGDKQFPWHQDDGYTPVDPSPYLTVWIALNDATPENGCISVRPGSHKNGLVPHEPTPIGLACYPLDDPDQGIFVPLKAGSLVAFQSLTMHKSGVNRTQGTRKAYIAQYAKAGLRSAITKEPTPLRNSAGASKRLKPGREKPRL